jgi:molybdopterin biosynthesis enzyme
MARANALLVIPPERTRIEAGEFVDALVLRDDVQHSATPAVS